MITCRVGGERLPSGLSLKSREFDNGLGRVPPHGHGRGKVTDQNEIGPHAFSFIPASRSARSVTFIVANTAAGAAPGTCKSSGRLGWRKHKWRSVVKRFSPEGALRHSAVKLYAFQQAFSDSDQEVALAAEVAIEHHGRYPEGRCQSAHCQSFNAALVNQQNPRGNRIGACKLSSSKVTNAKTCRGPSCGAFCRSPD